MNAPGRAEAFVLAWADRYTSGLPQDLAERRLLELTSDCFEQRRRGREVGAHPRAVATSLVVRTLAGVPADLAWRHRALAARRSRPLSEGGRPMGRWMKDNWWVALGGAMAVLTTVLGVGLPFEDRTIGAAIGGVVIGLLGLTGLAGLFVRRRPRRRTTGDLMIAAAQLPWIPFFWTVVPPILALIVIVAAIVDISDAASTGRDSVGGPQSPGMDWASFGLLAGLALGVAAALVVGDPAFVLSVPTPIALLLLLRLTLGRRLAGNPLLQTGVVLLATPPLWFLTIIGIGAFEDGYGVDQPYEYLVMTTAASMLVVGAGLVIAGVRRGRLARPA